MIKITEHQLQVQCVEWFRLQYPEKLIFAIPNGAKRNIVTAVKLKKEGVLAGVPDLFIPYLKLFIELKVGKNKLTQSQADVQKHLKECNFKVYTCYSFDEFSELVKQAFWGFEEFKKIMACCY